MTSIKTIKVQSEWKLMDATLAPGIQDMYVQRSDDTNLYVHKCHLLIFIGVLRNT